MNQLIFRLKPCIRCVSSLPSTLQRIVSTSTATPKKDLYVLPMFPYPSGNLHMGHVRVYSITDCLSRYYTLKGFKVLHTIGWDAFGLPAENAARDRGVDPKVWTEQNIKQMKTQLQKLNIGFDWSREINTSSPEYYKWTQYLFLQLYKAGLVHYKNAPVYYDPIDKTVLADEQIDSEGRSWRSGAIAELKVLKQWYIDISNYAAELYDNIDQLKEWPEVIKQLQRNWIGKQEGYTLQFTYQFDPSLSPSFLKAHANPPPLSIFTSKLESLVGLEFISLSPLHPLVNLCKEISPEMKTEIEKQCLTILSHTYGLKCNEIYTYQLPIQFYHPLQKKLIPVVINNTVIADHKDHIKLGVPGENEVDKKIADLLHIPYQEIYQKTGTSFLTKMNCIEKGTVMVHAEEMKVLAMSVKACRESIASFLTQHTLATPTTYTRLRDWSVARQRYWGAPLPIIHCPHCGTVPVPEEELPLALPEGKPDIPYGQENDYLTPLQHYSKWIQCTCPQCGQKASRDGNTLDTFLDSSWYYLRYPDAHNDKEIFSSTSMEPYRGQVDYYIGGSEHSVGHLLYARFIRLFFTKQGLLPPGEPFKRIYSQGMVLGPTYIDPTTGEYIRKENVIKKEGQYYNKQNNHLLKEEMMKMSKSKYNGIDPLQVIEQYGSDAVRFGVLFKCPISNEFPWTDEVCEVALRFKSRVDHCLQRLRESQHIEAKEDYDLYNNYVQLIHSMEQNMEKGDLHIAISKLMTLVNALNDAPTINQTYRTICKALPLYLYPYMPLYAQQVYSQVYNQLFTDEEKQKFSTNLNQCRWPTLTKPVTYKVIVQVNNKKHSILTLSENEFNEHKDEITDYIVSKEQFKGVMQKKPKSIKTVVKNKNVVINIINTPN